MQSTIHASKCRDGMTLVEVLVASVILFTVVGSMYASLIQARYLARVTAHRAHALQICRSNIEALRQEVGYADPFLNEGLHTEMPSTVPQVVEIDGRVMFVEYNPYYFVTNVALLGNPHVSYKEVYFFVDWLEQTLSGAREHRIKMNTAISSSLNR